MTTQNHEDMHLVASLPRPFTLQDTIRYDTILFSSNKIQLSVPSICARFLGPCHSHYVKIWGICTQEDRTSELIVRVACTVGIGILTSRDCLTHPCISITSLKLAKQQLNSEWDIGLAMPEAGNNHQTKYQWCAVRMVTHQKEVSHSQLVRSQYTT